VFVSLIRAGELSGTLTEVFENLGATLKWQDELVSQTRRLLVYPSLVFVVVTGRNGLPALVPRPQVTQLLKNHGAGTPDSDADN